MQGQFKVWVSTKRDKLRDLRVSQKNRHVFLYEEALVFCKSETQDGDHPIYQFKQKLQVQNAFTYYSAMAETIEMLSLIFFGLFIEHCEYLISPG